MDRGEQLSRLVVERVGDPLDLVLQHLVLMPQRLLRRAVRSVMSRATPRMPTICDPRASGVATNSPGIVATGLRANAELETAVPSLEHGLVDSAARGAIVRHHERQRTPCQIHSVRDHPVRSRRRD